ncbi:MAG: hypothetical protein K2J60_06235 [Acetatifactor sp.]|nr:hypothetical protein [Acetatifactor sp.]
MAVAKQKEVTPKETATREEVRQETMFSKEQIMTSEKYAGKRDLVNALLEEGKKYTFGAVDNEIETFMKGEVKN